jgi:hypothetical protein
MADTVDLTKRLPRGAIPSPRHELAAAMPHIPDPTIAVPPSFLMWPPQMSSWNNYVYGDCVTAEEAFAKATAAPQTFIPLDAVVAWATAHGVLNGASLTGVLSMMQTSGFPFNYKTYNDGPYNSVNWTNASILQSAIYSYGPVKIGVGAGEFQSNAHGLVTPGTCGWAMYDYPTGEGEDHCTSLCGYGTLAELVALFKQHGVTVNVPAGMPTGPCYAMFTWNSIGIIDQQSMLNMTYEAWIRNPVTKIVNQDPIWGINAGEQIYNWNGTSWTLIPGSLVTIAVNAGQVWGINKGQAIYKWNGTSWTQIAGALVSIAVGSDGEVWGINAGQEIYKWNGTSWTQIAGALVTIAVNAGQVWGINKNQEIYKWNGTSWTQIAGALVSIAVGSDGEVWGINAGQEIYKWNGTSWTHIAGALVTIAVNAGQVWGINKSQEIYKWNGSSWTQIAGALVSIAVGADGQVWGLNAGQEIYQWNGTNWTHIAGALVTIAVA